MVVEVEDAKEEVAEIFEVVMGMGFLVEEELLAVKEPAFVDELDEL